MPPFSFKRWSMSSAKTSESSLFSRSKSNATDTAHREVAPSSILYVHGTRLQDDAFMTQDGYAELLEDENVSWGINRSTRNDQRFIFRLFKRKTQPSSTTNA